MPPPAAMVAPAAPSQYPATIGLRSDSVERMRVVIKAARPQNLTVTVSRVLWAEILASE
jgi:hypothetical protein